jgi:hypothetical protein
MDEKGIECSTHAEKRNSYRILAGKQGKVRWLGKPRRKKDNIKTNPRDIGWDGMDWSYLTQHRTQWSVLVNTIMNFRVP